MFPPLDVSNLFLAYLALVFGTSLVFLLGGGWRQLLGLLKPEAGAAAATLAFGPWPMIAAVSLLGSAAFLAPSLLPGAGLAAGLLLVSYSGSRPANFWDSPAATCSRTWDTACTRFWFCFGRCCCSSFSAPVSTSPLGFPFNLSLLS